MSEQTNILMAQQELIKPSTAWLMFLFLGWSYGSMGSMGKQILFYITLGGLGIWMLIRLFTLNGAIRTYNNAIYKKYGIVATPA